jgi:hypothetical protein
LEGVLTDGSGGQVQIQKQKPQQQVPQGQKEALKEGQIDMDEGRLNEPAVISIVDC